MVESALRETQCARRVLVVDDEPSCGCSGRSTSSWPTRVEARLQTVPRRSCVHRPVASISCCST